MSGSDPDDKGPPPRRDPFAAMMARLNEQLARDVAQSALSLGVHRETVADDDSPTASAPPPVAQPPEGGNIQQPAHISESAARAQLSAEAMARASAAMRRAMPLAEAEAVSSIPPGPMRVLARRRRLLIWLGLVFGVAALASLGISFLRPSLPPPAPARPQQAVGESEAASVPSATASMPAPHAETFEQQPPAQAPATPPPAAPASEPAAPASEIVLPAPRPPAAQSPPCTDARQALGLCTPVVH